MPAPQPSTHLSEPLPDLAWPDGEFDVLLASGIDAPQAEPDPSSSTLGLFDALAPLVTDVRGASERAREHEADRHAALLFAIAELAETHAVAADLAYRQAAIDLPLDVPDPVLHAFDDSTATSDGRSSGKPMSIVPDVIRTCRDRLAVYADAADRMKLDIVATLFDHVAADDRLPTEVRNALARLQLPVLRMALADESFFASRTHPTRRLLDRLAQASNPSTAEWKEDSDAARACRSELERIVHAVVRGSSEDAGEHARLLEEFECRLVEIAATATPALALVPDEEDRDVLVIKATIQISQLLAGLEVDRGIRFFLLDVWSRVLGEIVGANPAAGFERSRDAMLARAKRLCVDLAWSAAPKTTSGERARLAGLLPTMIEALRDGLSMIDYPKAEQDRFFAEWARTLYVAVKASHAPGEINRQFRIADHDAPQNLDIDTFARRLRARSFGPEAPPGDARRDSDAERASERSGLRGADDRTPSMLSGVPREASPPAASSPPIPALAELRKGEWFELREPRGYVRVRLSWISPLRTFYLFIGADSALTRSFAPAALEGLLSRGDLRRLPDTGERRA